MSRLIRQLLAPALALLAALASAPASSQYTSDIDLYTVQNTSTDLPNVLIILDNTANWTSMFSREMQALGDTLQSLPANKFNVGLMLFTESGGGNSGPDGGYVRAAIRKLGVDATTGVDYRSRLRSLVTSFDVTNDRSNGGKAGMTMAEAWYYYNGNAPVTGNNKLKTDFRGNSFGSSQSRDIYALPGNALNALGGSPYNRPTLSECARNFIIYISNGAAQDNSSDSATASAALSAAYQAESMSRPPDITNLPVSGSQTNMADEWARFMKESRRAITTFTLDIDPITSGQGPGWSALLSSMATHSGGQYFALDSSVNNGSKVADALNKIFNQIQATDSVFTSASLPVSMNSRGAYANQVFLGMFKPDRDARPRWRGNVKQYAFAYNPLDGSLKLVDADGVDAVTGTTGYISPNASSYWTSSSSFWVNQPLGTPATGNDKPDGEVTEKGGAAQRQRVVYATSQAARKVYVCANCPSSPASHINLSTDPNSQFTTDNNLVSTTSLGVATSTDRANLINWVRGADNAGDESGPGGTTTVRPSIQGDVLHSRPAVINYGDSKGVVVFYGSNDGMLRAISGSNDKTDANAGNELWAFIPGEQLGKLKRLRDNSPEVRLSTTFMSTQPGVTLPTPRDYFVDGPIGVYQRLTTSGTVDVAYLFVGMRRGGREIYALDVSDPKVPKFMWKRTSATGDLPVLGQTWSEPRVARLKGYDGPVLIMGAGYDNTAEDLEPAATLSTMGKAVLVLDAKTGTLIKQFDTSRSVAADVALVDSDYDGYVDRAYAADVGGNLYRIDFEKETNGVASTGTSSWGIYPFASLAGDAAPKRKFFYAPDVVLSRDFTAVLVGSGDREKPLAISSNDRFFTLYDTLVKKGTPDTPPRVLLPSDLGDVRDGAKAAGCYISLAGASGEKVVNAPTTVGGVTYFATNQPPAAAPNSCSANLGVATAYAAPLFCKATVTKGNIRGGGMPPSVVAGTAIVRYRDPNTGQDSERAVNFRIGGPNAKESALEVSPITSGVSSSRRRRYWFLENAR